jgi:hypothetical protein
MSKLLILKVEDENYNVMILRAKNITKTIILKKLI